VNVKQLKESGWNLAVTQDDTPKKVATDNTVRLLVEKNNDSDLLAIKESTNSDGERVVAWSVVDAPVIQNLTTEGTFTSNGPAVFNEAVTMKKGLNMSGTKITNLAPGDIGPDSTDAVNGSQLYALGSNINNQFNNFNAKLNRDIARVGSRAAALAALHPLDYDPDKPTSIMAGFGHYKGDSSLALGVAHHFNDDTLLTVGSTIGHDTMVNVGLSLRLGRNTNMTEKRWKVQRHTAVDYDARLKVMERRYKDLQLDKDAEIAGLRQRLQFLEEDMKALRGSRGAKR
jgi:hypothetical protein